MDVPQIVLITGCSTGIGLTTAILLAKNGDRKYKVYATVKDLARKGKLEKEAGSLLDSTVFIKELDVTSNEQIYSVVDEIIKAEAKIDILSTPWLFVRHRIRISIRYSSVRHAQLRQSDGS